MERRRLLQAGGVVGGTICIGGIFGTVFGGSTTVEGTVEAKSLTGMQGETSHGIVLAQRGDLSVEDDAYEDAFASWEAVVVDSELERELEFEYRTLQYNVHVTHTADNERQDVAAGESLAYRVSRDQFNAIGIGDDLTFQTAGSEIPRIETVM